MPIAKKGWELHVKRLGIQKKGSLKRTYGEYQVYIDGKPESGLSGHMCETIGPGDNKKKNNGKRIEEGTYPLWTQFGRYRTIGYSEDLQTPGANHMPGLLLQGTAARDGILIHPGHPPKLYLSSVGCFNPTNPLSANEVMNFWDSRVRVIALIESLKNLFPKAFLHEASTHIEAATVVVDGEPKDEVSDVLTNEFASAKATPAPASLPVSEKGAKQCAEWMVKNFGAELAEAVKGKKYRVKHLCAIVCQETAYKWLKWIGTHSTEKIIERCVFDASGDYPGTSRSAFPKNTAVFRERFGGKLTDMLIEEANITRRLQDYGDKEWVYKGYGIFQYDLQHILIDESFFSERKWYSFRECLSRCCSELDTKLKDSDGDLWDAIRRYNGSGERAKRYMENVKVFTDYCGNAIGN
jgi:hypothetical protein